VQHCYECHSEKAKEPKGKLRLDTAAGWRRGGESGPAIEPGKPQQSLLIDAIRWGTLEMPPTGKLPDAVIADFVKWVELGAPDPRGESGLASASPAGSSKELWSLKPIPRRALPPVRNTTCPQTAIDRFVLARLESAGLSPSPSADKRTLLRRVFIDLIGLPPTADEVAAFERDESPDAFARIVDRLLASPHYGERWGRHWLDVARFADTKDGVLMYGDDRIRPYAYTYRDYVVRAFNEDLPFDRFVHEQLAADLIQPAVEPWRLAALGYLTLGRMFDNNIHDIIDDRIDTVTRGFLGMTVSCARCHDHKYDAIPTADYYSLYGVFSNCDAPLELPLIDGALSDKAQVFEKQVEQKRQELRKTLDSQYEMLSETARQRVGDYLVHVATTKPDPLETAIYFLSLAPEDLRPPIVARWRRFIRERATPNDPVFGPWHDLMQLPEAELAGQVAGVLSKWKSRPQGPRARQINPLVLAALENAPLASRGDVAKAYGGLLKGIYERAKPKDNSAASTEPAEEQLLEIVASQDSPAYFPKSHTRHYMSRGEKDAFGGKLQELDRMAVQSPNAPPRAMTLVDSTEIDEPRVFQRGDPSRPGERVPRQFLSMVSTDRKPFGSGSGRLDLAKEITSPRNPLTSRVIVNRIWMHHFGEPLVGTPSDFGIRSSPPVQAELLDYLALQLQRDGWSLKKLHREIVLSATYQQSSRDRPDCRRVDPENRLLWRQNRRRLDFEAMRDGLLAISGRLERRMLGRPVDITGDWRSGRRTLYGLVDRQSLPGLYRAFDFAVPDQSVERRPQTTVPQQALFGLNSPFMHQQARALVARSEVQSATPRQRVAAIFSMIFARPAEGDEVDSALSFFTSVSSQSGDKSTLSPLEQLAQVLLLTNELMFVD
jgi:hypothetical protein